MRVGDAAIALDTFVGRRVRGGAAPGLVADGGQSVMRGGDAPAGASLLAERKKEYGQTACAPRKVLPRRTLTAGAIWSETATAYERVLPSTAVCPRVGAVR